MANNITVTEADVFIPEIWSKELIADTESKLVLGKLAWSFDKDAKMGDTIHVPSLTNLVANDKLKNVEVQLQAPTETNTDISINKHKEVSFLIEDLAQTQSHRDLRAPYTEKAGYALAKAMDTDLATLAASFSQTKGTYNTAITTDVVLDSIELLDTADAPENDRYFVFRPDVKRDLLDLAAYTSSDYVEGRPVQTGSIGMLYGVNTYMSTNIAKSVNNTNNMLFQKEAIALAKQKNVRVQSDYEIKELGWVTVADCVYGVKEMRDDHAVLVKT
jgi:N4-gp56 family major capsid protein